MAGADRRSVRVVAVPADWPPPAAWPIVRAVGPDDLLPALFRHLLTWAAEGAASGVERTTAHLLAAFVGGETATDAIPAEVAPEAVGRVQAYIFERLDLEPAAPIRLGDLAAVAWLDRAATLLARSNHAIAEIAAMCGFVSPFHFSRRFKESYGEPPRSLRERVRAGAVPPEPRLLRVVRT